MRTPKFIELMVIDKLRAKKYMTLFNVNNIINVEDDIGSGECRINTHEGHNHIVLEPYVNVIKKIKE